MAALPDDVRARLARLADQYRDAPDQYRDTPDQYRDAPDQDQDTPDPAGEVSTPGAAAGIGTPEHSDEVMLANTGRRWKQWRELIDAWPGHDEGHTAVAAWLTAEHEVPGWWAQAITVGWERLTGRRLPHQMADGTFTANRSATIHLDAAVLGALLRDEEARAALFPGLDPQLRSRATSKNVRIALRRGIAELSIIEKNDGRATVTVQHAKLPAFADVAHWRSFWGEWLAALDGTTAEAR